MQSVSGDKELQRVPRIGSEPNQDILTVHMVSGTTMQTVMVAETTQIPRLLTLQKPATRLYKTETCGFLTTTIQMIFERLMR